jgi:hypothetical protein
MQMIRRLLRYAFLALAIAGLMISIKACASPPVDQATSSTSAGTPTSTMAEGHSNRGKKININSAILSELDKFEAQLGIPALSHKIQASRPYGNPEDLVSKKVITQAQFDRIKDQLTVEEIVLTGEAKDVDYMTKLGLMKGHMIVAAELLALGKPEQAVPHLEHPVEEIYVDLADQFTERQVPEFKDTLTQVQDLVKSKPNDPQVKPKFDAAMVAIDRAIAALPESQRQSTSFGLQVINGLLETATAEYGAAITDGKVKAAIEYQDSRGFVAYAQDTVFKGIAPQLKQTNPKAYEQMSAHLTQLRTAWPQPIPPATPVLTVDQVAAKVKQIEMDSKPVISASVN